MYDIDDENDWRLNYSFTCTNELRVTNDTTTLHATKNITHIESNGKFYSVATTNSNSIGDDYVLFPLVSKLGGTKIGTYYLKKKTLRES